MPKTKRETEYRYQRCPICGLGYPPGTAKPAPTCGHPNCIREARARGLPITPPAPIITGKPTKWKKRTKGK